MRKITEKSWVYSLYENDTDIILSIVCGTVGIFEINIVLNSFEKEQFLVEGDIFIERLVQDVQNKPNLYTSRHIGKLSNNC
jgi:hypothetical protein